MASLRGELRSVYTLAGSLVAFGALAIYLASNSTSAKAKRAKAKLPPGPKQHFLLGNVFNFPKDRWYEAFTSWSEEYGDVVYVNLAGVHMIVLNSLEAVQELVEKRMSIHSERPFTTMSNELMGAGYTMMLLPTGPAFTEQRKVFHKFLGKQVTPDYDEPIRRHGKRLTQQVDGFIGDPYDPLMKTVGGILTTIAYGEKIYREHGEALIEANINNTSLISWVFTKVWMVDMIPALRYIPSWFPGAGFKRVAKQGLNVANKIRYWAYEIVESGVADGTADESIVSRQLKEPGISNANLRDAVAVMFGAGVDTTVASIINFLYAMVLYPEWQKKVQKEMEVVLGHGHLPTMKDISRLDIFSAAWKESLRWNPPAPLGVPHVSNKDDVWNGYYIPKGTIIHCNIGQVRTTKRSKHSLRKLVRLILRDSRLWGEDGHQFNPGRFLAEKNPAVNELPDIWSIPFGFGRRICPGRFLAERVALQISAAILSAYKVLPPEGETIPQGMSFEDSVIRRPSNFRCRFEPLRPNH